jgi:chemotaxis protein CheX
MNLDKQEVLTPFIQATVSVLKTMAGVEARPGEIFVKESDTAKGDISGIVGFAGYAKGSLCITFTKKCILFIVGQIFGEEKTAIDTEVKDAVGELTNVISGDSRRRLEELGYLFSGSIPSVISGEGHEVKHVTKGPILSIPFTTQAGDFFVEVCFN